MEKNAEQLIAGLNEDLVGELTAIHQYIYYASVVSGLARLTLKDFFQQEAADEMEHASYLAEKIFSLGGEPKMEAKPIPKTDDIKEMLEQTHQAEVETIQRYTERIQQAKEYGDIELVTKLEDMIADETKHKEEMERILRDPSFL